MVRLLVATGIVASSAAVVASPHLQTVFRSDTRVVIIEAAVTKAGRAVTTLTMDDFTLRDNGVAQRLLDFDHDSQAIDLTVTIDISGSMNEADRRSVEGAVAAVSRALTPDDRISVWTFGSAIEEQAPLKAPPVRLNLNSIGGGSAVLDALLLSLVSTRRPARRPVHIFMTDGEDNASAFDARTVVDTAAHSAAPVSIVLVRNRAGDRFLGTLRSVTAITGGELLELKGKSELSEAFLATLDHFRRSYVLRYTPTGVPSGGWHDVTVSVAGAGYEIRARRGYWDGS